MAIKRSGRGRTVPVDNQPSPATRGCGRGRKRHRSPSLPSNPTPNQHRQEEEEEEQQQQQLVRNQSIPEEQQESIVEEQESVESLIEGLHKESLVALAMEAISNDPHLIERVRNLAEVDPAQREIFVSQYGRQDMPHLTSEMLYSFFGRYGEIENCSINVKQMCGTTKSRAYITFKQRKATWEAAKQPSHRIGDICVRCIMLPNASRWLQLPGVLRYKYKLPENQYATTEEESVRDLQH